MLEGVVQHGTAFQARELGRPVGGKTGTTNDFRSAWFIGFTPQLVVGTFVGFDDNRSLGHGETGAVAAVPIFIEFMKEALKGYPVMDFTPPPGAVLINIGGNREAFLPDMAPHGPVPSASVDHTPHESLAPVAGSAPPSTPDTAPVPQAAPPPPRPGKPPKPTKADDTAGLY
jgi:penicillin-binding protein 1A